MRNYTGAVRKIQVQLGNLHVAGLIQMDDFKVRVAVNVITTAVVSMSLFKHEICVSIYLYKKNIKIVQKKWHCCCVEVDFYHSLRWENVF